MARDDWEYGSDDFWETPDPPDIEDILYGKNDESLMDLHAQELMFDAIVHGNDDAYAELTRYMWDEYGLDFEDAWDWEDFREWYLSQ